MANKDSPALSNTQGLSLLFLAGLALLSAGGPLGTDMYLPALPIIGRDLDTTTSMTQLTITTYMVGMAIGQLLIGPISDSLGRRKLLIGGMLLGLVASLVISLAPTIEIIIIARLAQGTAGGAGVVLARAIISDRLHGSAAAKAFSVMMMIIGVAPILAPVLGGVINETVGWRGVFWTLTVIAIVQIIVSILTPETHPAEKRSTGGPIRTYRSMVQLLKRPGFMGYVIAFSFGFGAMFAYIAGSSFVFQEQFDMSPVGYSLMFALNALALLLANSVNIRVVGRFGPAKLQFLALLIMLVGTVLVLLTAVFVPKDVDWAVPVVVAAIFVATFGVGLNMSNATALAQDLAADRAGAGSALLGAAQFLVAGASSPLVGLGSDRLLTMAVTMIVSTGIALAGTMMARTYLSR